MVQKKFIQLLSHFLWIFFLNFKVWDFFDCTAVIYLIVEANLNSNIYTITTRVETFASSNNFFVIYAIFLSLNPMQYNITLKGYFFKWTFCISASPTNYCHIYPSIAADALSCLPFRHSTNRGEKHEVSSSQTVVHLKKRKCFLYLNQQLLFDWAHF